MASAPEPTWPGDRLIAEAQRGDAGAIAALVSGSHRRVHRFAASLCATPEDAEDAAQEALIILFRKVGMLRAMSALGSWLFQIVRTECLRRARAWSRRPDLVVPESVSSAEEETLRRLEIDRITSAIAALPRDQRLVLVMRDVQGLPGGVVARALGLSTSATKSRLHRARAQVRAELAGHRAEVRGDRNDER